MLHGVVVGMSLNTPIITLIDLMIERESVENSLEIWQLAPLWGFLMWGVSSLITQTERSGPRGGSDACQN